MIDTAVKLTNVRVAADPMFYPGPDPKQYRCMIPVIKNMGKNSVTGAQMTQSYTVIFWAKYAEMAAVMIEKGRQVTIDGVLRVFPKVMGIGPDGKKIYNNITTVHARRFELGADSGKALDARVNARIAEGKAAGLIPQQMTVGADYLLKIERPKYRQFNPAEVAATGRFGFAKVSLGKGQGFASAVNMPAPAPALILTQDQITAQIAALQAQFNAGTAAKAAVAVGSVDPFVMV